MQVVASIISTVFVYYTGSELPLKEAEDGETSTTEVNTINRRPTASGQYKQNSACYYTQGKNHMLGKY